MNPLPTQSMEFKGLDRDDAQRIFRANANDPDIRIHCLSINRDGKTVINAKNPFLLKGQPGEDVDAFIHEMATAKRVIVEVVSPMFAYAQD